MKIFLILISNMFLDVLVLQYYQCFYVSFSFLYFMYNFCKKTISYDFVYSICLLYNFIIFLNIPLKFYLLFCYCTYILSHYKYYFFGNSFFMTVVMFGLYMLFFYPYLLWNMYNFIVHLLLFFLLFLYNRKLVV